MFRSAIRLITFDLDDTLWPCEPVIRAAEEALHHWLGAEAPRLAQAHDLASLREHRRAIMEREPEIAHDLGLVRLRSLSGLLEEFGYPRRLAEAGVDVFMEHRNRVEPYADVIPALRLLGQRFHLVAVTNGNASVERTPLRGLFSHSITAAEAGAAKPDPALFMHALELTGCSPAETLHLGDDPWLDVEAARAFGLTAIWVDRHGRAWPDALAPPALAVSSLHEFTAWLSEDIGEDDGV